MPDQPPFDLPTAHRFFAADCFNRAWGFIDQPDRTPADDTQMLLLAMASLWHWTQRPDVSPETLSIGYWQVSRVYCLLNQPANALAFANLCLQSAQSEGVAPFALGFAYETLARAALLAGDRTAAAAALASARQVTAAMEDEEAQAMIEADLATINL